MVADRAVMAMSDFVIGANQNDYHYTGANVGRDFPEPRYSDLRNVVEGDPSPDAKGTLEICRGIEVGHIFQLRHEVLERDEPDGSGPDGPGPADGNGLLRYRREPHRRGCDQQNHDERGIVFPPAMAPFDLCIVPIGLSKSGRVRQTAEQLHRDLSEIGLEVLLDDRDERPGIMFADMELVGIPHRLVVGERGLKDGNVEYRGRRDDKATVIPLTEAVAFIREKTEVR